MVIVSVPAPVSSTMSPVLDRIVPVATTELGVIAPRVNVIAGVVVGFATDPDTPFAVTTETDVTVPAPPDRSTKSRPVVWSP